MLEEERIPTKHGVLILRRWKHVLGTEVMYEGNGGNRVWEWFWDRDWKLDPDPTYDFVSRIYYRYHDPESRLVDKILRSRIGKWVASRPR